MAALEDLRALVFPALALLASQGCERHSPLIPVSGKVTLEGRPLVHGAVSYRPPGDLTLPQPTGPLDSEGRYRLFTDGRLGAPAGEYRVVVFAYDQPTAGAGHRGLPRSLISDRYHQADTTPLVRQVQPNAPNGAYDLELEP
jgi:hypothetical protein